MKIERVSEQARCQLLEYVFIEENYRCAKMVRESIKRTRFLKNVNLINCSIQNDYFLIGQRLLMLFEVFDLSLPLRRNFYPDQLLLFAGDSVKREKTNFNTLSLTLTVTSNFTRVNK